MVRTTIDGSQILDATIQAIDADDSIEKTSNRGIALGYTPLDIDSKIPTNYLGSSLSDITTFLRGDRVWSIINHITSGNYVGNDVANRPIMHSLGVMPQAIIICNIDGKIFMLIIPGTISYGNLIKSVQVWDATNFYVGPGLIGQANQVGKTYYWVAFG